MHRSRLRSGRCLESLRGNARDRALERRQRRFPFPGGGRLRGYVSHGVQRRLEAPGQFNAAALADQTTYGRRRSTRVIGHVWKLAAAAVATFGLLMTIGFLQTDELEPVEVAPPLVILGIIAVVLAVAGTRLTR